MGFILYIVSLIGKLIFAVSGPLYGIGRSFVKVQPKTGLRNADKKFYAMAGEIDRLGAVFCSELFDDTLITPNATRRFGEPGITISETLGYALQEREYTRTGMDWIKILDFVDPGHCQRSIGAPITFRLTRKQRIWGWVFVSIMVAEVAFTWAVVRWG